MSRLFVVMCVLLAFSVSVTTANADTVYSNPGGSLFAFLQGNRTYVEDKSYFTPTPIAEPPYSHAYDVANGVTRSYAVSGAYPQYPTFPVAPIVSTVRVAQVAVMPRYYPVRGNNWTTPTSNHPFYSRHAAIRHLMNEHGYSEESLQGYSLSELNSLHSDTHEGQVKMAIGPSMRTGVVVSKPVLNFNQAYSYGYSGGCPGGVCPVNTMSRREYRRNR